MPNEERGTGNEMPKLKPKTIHVLGVPMDLGSGRRGVDMGPSAIRIAGLHHRLTELGHKVIDQGDIDIHNMEELKVGDLHARYIAEITRANKALAATVSKVMSRGQFPLVLGGDHSIAVGTVSGIAAWGRAKGKKVGMVGDWLTVSEPARQCRSTTPPTCSR